MAGGKDRGRASRGAALQRDAALARVGRTRRVLIGATAGLTAALAYFVSAVAPGRTLTSSHAATGEVASAASATTSGTAAPTGSAAGARASTTMPPLASPSQLGLQAPDQAPQAAAPSTPSASAS
ncbi:MAG: hypothetical protein ABSG43_04745, partial [Solirubrobacteraceae bacterium]